MRVIAGVAKGRRLVAPAGQRTRPTSDRVKEALFSRLQPRLAGARVVDLFAGSGALGIEALSRGADRVTFVESDRRALAAVRANLAACRLGDHATVVAREATASLEPCPAGAPFDLALLDPPYQLAAARLTGVLTRLVPCLTPGALVSVELATRSAPPTWPAALLPAAPRRYGDTTLHAAEMATTARSA